MQKNLRKKNAIFKHKDIKTKLSIFIVLILFCSSFSAVVADSSLNDEDKSGSDDSLTDNDNSNPDTYDILLTYTFDPPVYSDVTVTDIDYSLNNSNSSLIDDNVTKPNSSALRFTNYTFGRLEMDGTTNFNIPGAPVLPMKPLQILIPYGYTIEDIVVKYDNNTMSVDNIIEPGKQPISFNDMYKTIDDNFVIDPESPLSISEQYQTKAEQYSSSVTLDESIYEDYETFYPYQELRTGGDEPTVKETIGYKVVTSQKSRGYNILALNLYPVRYRSTQAKDPDGNMVDDPYGKYSGRFGNPPAEISYSTSMSVKISTKRSTDYNDETFRGLESDRELIVDKLENPELIETYDNKEISSETIQSYPYIIITSNALKNHDDSYNFQRLLNYRGVQGLSGKIVTIEEIENDFEGENRAEKIRNFISYAYKNWHTDYVLLGGDDGVIPAKELNSNSVNVPSDLYYSCLDGDGPSGYVDDIMSEVYIGRAPVETTDEVSNFVRKTLSYEVSSADDGDDYLNNALWSGEYLCGPQSPLEPYGVNTWGKDYKEETVGDEGLPVGDTGFNLETLYDKDVSSEYSGGWDSLEMIDKINSGFNLVSHVGHGAVESDLKIVSSYVDSMTNYNENFFVYSQSCLSGRFTEDDCFAETLTVKNNAGAFAAVMNTGNGYGVSGSTNGPSQQFDKSFWKNLFDEEKAPLLGTAHQISKEDNINLIDFSRMRDVYYSSTLFGDPAVGIKGTPGEQSAPSEGDNVLLGTSSTSENDGMNSQEDGDEPVADDPNTYKIYVDPEYVSYGANTSISYKLKKTDGEREWSWQIIDPDGITQADDTLEYWTISFISSFKPSSYTSSYVGTWEINCSDDYGGSKSVFLEVVEPEDENTTGVDIDGDGVIGGLGEEDDDVEDRINFPPDKPEIVAPADGTGGYDPNYVGCKPLPDPNPGNESACKPMAVSVRVYDLNDDNMDVYFYNEEDDSLIGAVYGVSSGGFASVGWLGLDYGETYSWYAIADDYNYQPEYRYGTVFTAVSDVASFSTIENSSDYVSHWWNNSWDFRRPMFFSLGSHIRDTYTIGSYPIDPETGDYLPEVSNCNYLGETGEFNFELTIDKLPGMRDDFQDIRFVLYDDDETEVHYWIKSYNDTCAKIQLKLVDCFVTMFMPRACVWMYYGNDDAENVSSYEWFYTGLEREWTKTGFSEFSRNSLGPHSRGGVYATQVDVDSENNIIIVGYNKRCPDERAPNSWVVIKLNSEGELLWERQTPEFPSSWYYNLPASQRPGAHRVDHGGGDTGWSYPIYRERKAYPADMAVDSQGNIIVVGGELDRPLVFKYSSDGQLLWSDGLGSQDGFEPEVVTTSVAVDSQDNIIVAGGPIRGTHESGFGDQRMGHISVYSPDGELITPGEDPNSLHGIQLYVNNGWNTDDIRYVSSIFDIQLDSDDNIIISGSCEELTSGIGATWVDSGLLLKLCDFKDAGLKTYNRDIGVFYNDTWHVSELNPSSDCFNMTGLDVSDIYDMSANIYDLRNDSNCSSALELLDLILSEPVTLRYGINVVNDGLLPLEDVDIPLNFVSYNGNYVFDNVSNVQSSSYYIDSQLNFTETYWSDYDEVDARFIEIMYQILSYNPPSNFSINISDPSPYWLNYLENFEKYYDFDFSEYFDSISDSVFWSNFEYITIDLIMKMGHNGFQDIDPPNFNIHLDSLGVGQTARISFFVKLNNTVVMEIINDLYSDDLLIDGNPFHFNNVGMNLPSTPLLTYYLDENLNKSLGIKIFNYDVTANSRKGSLSVSDYGDILVLENIQDTEVIEVVDEYLPEDPLLDGLVEPRGGWDYGIVIPDPVTVQPYWKKYTHSGLSRMWKKEKIKIGGQNTSVIEDIVVDGNDIIVNYNGNGGMGPGTADINGGIATFSVEYGSLKSYKAENIRPVAIIDQSVDEESPYENIDGSVIIDSVGQLCNLSAYESYDLDGQIIEYRWFKGYETQIGPIRAGTHPFVTMEKMFASGKTISFDPFLNNPEGFSTPDYIRLEVVDNSGEVDRLGNTRVSYPADWKYVNWNGGFVYNPSVVRLHFMQAIGLMPWGGDGWNPVQEWISGEFDDNGQWVSGHWACFLKDTQVEMSDGSIKNIQDIKIGDSVCSYDESSGEWKNGEVTELFHHDPDEMTDYYLIINDDLCVTPNHPILVDGEWINAGELEIGDIYGGNLIRSIERVYSRQPTYNFEVEPYHTYCVIWGDSQISSIVHNKNAGIQTPDDGGGGGSGGGGGNHEPPDPDHDVFIAIREREESSSITDESGLEPTTEIYKAGTSETIEFVGVLSSNILPGMPASNGNYQAPGLINEDILEAVWVFQIRDNRKLTLDDISSSKHNITVENGFVQITTPLTLVSSPLNPDYREYITSCEVEFLNKGLYAVGLKFRYNTSIEDYPIFSEEAENNAVVNLARLGILDVKTVSISGPSLNPPVADAGSQRMYSVTQEFNKNAASFSTPHVYRGVLGSNVHFDGSKSCDLDGYLMSPLTWEWGDGTVSYYDISGVDYNVLNNDILQEEDSSLPVSDALKDSFRILGPIHEYETEGDYNVNLTVVDNHGLTDSSQASVIIDGWTGGGWSSAPGEHGYTGHHLEIAPDESLYIITDQRISEIDKEYNVNDAVLDQLFTDGTYRHGQYVCGGTTLGRDAYGLATDQDGPFKYVYAVGHRSTPGEWGNVAGWWYGGVYLVKYHYYDIDNNIQLRRNGDHENMTLGPVYTNNPIIDFESDEINLGDFERDKIITGSFEIWNGGNATLDYTLLEDCDWLELDTTSGSSTGEHDAINFVIDTSGLTIGKQTCEILIDCDYIPKTVKISLNIVIPWLKINPQGHLFDDVPAGSQVSTSFNIWNWWTGTLEYSIVEDCDWLSVDTVSGNCTTEHDTINVNVDTAGLSPGFYSYDIQINSNSPNSGKDFTVTVQVIENGLSVDPLGFDFGNKAPGETDSAGFEIWTGGDETLEYSLSKGCSWVKVTPMSGNSTGEHDTITVDINTTGLSFGTHTCEIQISSNLGNNVFTVVVNVVDNSVSPVLSVNPGDFDFGVTSEGQTDSTSFDIYNSGTGVLDYSLSESCDWLSIDTVSGTSSGEHDTVTVNVDTNGLSDGDYSYGVQINSNGGTSVFTASFTVASESVLSVSPSGFDFGEIAVNSTDSTSFAIQNIGLDLLEYSLSESCSWLSLNTLIGNSTGESDTIVVSVDTVGLSPGVYSYDIQVSSNGGNSVFTVSLEVFENIVEKSISIVSPEPGFVYLFGSRFMKLKMLDFALVIGEVQVDYETSGFEPSYVELLVGGSVENDSVSDSARFVSNSKGFGRSVFKVVAYDEGDSVVCSDEIEIFNINLRGR